MISNASSGSDPFAGIRIYFSEHLLTPTTFHEYLKMLRTATELIPVPGQRLGLYSHLITAEEFATRNPGLANPVLPVIPAEEAPPEYDPVEGESQGAASQRATHYRIMKELHDCRMTERKQLVHDTNSVKALMMDPTVLGADNATAMQAVIQNVVAESAAVIYAALNKLLGELDSTAITFFRAFYQHPSELAMRPHFDRELQYHTLLAECSEEYTEAQRAKFFRAQFAHVPFVHALLADFDKEHPSKSDRTFARLKAKMLVQEINIKDAMSETRRAIYPDPLSTAMSANAGAIMRSATEELQALQDIGALTPAVHQALSSRTTFSRDEVLRLVAQALASQTGKAPPQRLPQTMPDAYCWLHSRCAHSSSECTQMQDGLPCSHRFRDSRYSSFDPSRVFGHPNCRHSPKCPSALEAKQATSPKFMPSTPGNAFRA
jgi:hypothetical protein